MNCEKIAEIDENGSFVTRNTRGFMNTRRCPFVDKLCGDWCPHFRVKVTSNQVEIKLCHGTEWVFPIQNFKPIPTL